MPILATLEHRPMALSNRGSYTRARFLVLVSSRGIRETRNCASRQSQQHKLAQDDSEKQQEVAKWQSRPITGFYLGRRARLLLVVLVAEVAGEFRFSHPRAFLLLAHWEPLRFLRLVFRFRAQIWSTSV